MVEVNWAGNHIFGAHTLHPPSTVEQLQEIAAAAPRIRVPGMRHCFSDIADAAELVALDGLPEDIARGAMTSSRCSTGSTRAAPSATRGLETRVLGT